MRRLAIIIPETIPSTISRGVQRVLSGLRHLPDDYLVYYEPLIHPLIPDIIIISPNIGLLVIEIRNWYPGHISAVSKDEVQIEDDHPRTEVHPLVHARKFLESLIQQSKKHPLFSSLLTHENGQESFRFPTEILLLLPNCTTSQLTKHRLGDLHSIFIPDHTVCREKLKGIERWEMVDLIIFLRSGMHSQNRHLPLTCEQVHKIRGIIHPDIIIEIPEPGNNQGNGPGLSLKILDSNQEASLYRISRNHHILFGQEGTGKTSILSAKAKNLHNRDDEHHTLILCFSTPLSIRLQKTFSHYPRIEVYSFEQWAEKNGISRQVYEGREESDLEFGTRLYQEIMLQGGNFQTYNAVFIDEGDKFPPIWFQCAVKALKKPEMGELFIVADEQKGIQGTRRIRWKDIGIQVRGRITRLGLKPDNFYHNTKEILDLARIFLIPEEEEDKEQHKNQVFSCDRSIRSGLKPLMVWNTSQDHQAEYAVYLVQRLLGSLKSAHYLSGIRPDDIAILYPHADMGDINIISAMIANLGRYFPVQWVSEDPATYKRIHLPGVKVHDCHSINGIHYRVVIILFAENFERFFQDSEFFSERCLLYCALTRPLDYLIIQYTDRTDIIRKILASGYVDEFIGKSSTPFHWHQSGIFPRVAQ